MEQKIVMIKTLINMMVALQIAQLQRQVGSVQVNLQYANQFAEMGWKQEKKSVMIPILLTAMDAQILASQNIL